MASTLREALPEFLLDLTARRGRSDNTVEAYGRDLLQFIQGTERRKGGKPLLSDFTLEVIRAYLHELASVGDSGLANLAALKSLEVLDIWTLPQMTDATVEVIAALPNMRELSIRTTDVTDAAVDKLLAMPQLQSLTFKENGRVTDEGLKKLAGKKWAKLDTGSAQPGEAP